MPRPSRSVKKNMNPVQQSPRAPLLFLAPALLVALIAVGVLRSQKQTFAATPTGLIGYWNFNEGAGSTVADTSDSNFPPGTIAGATWVDGRFGKALQFNGSQSVDLGKPAALADMWQYSWVVWVKPRTKAETPALNPSILTKGPYRILGKYYDGTVYRALLDLSSVSAGLHSLANSVDPTTWHMLTVTCACNTTQKTLTLFDNTIAQGLSVGQGAIPYNASDAAISLMVGATFDGMIDEVRVYNKALTAQDVADLYNSYTGENLPADDKLPTLSAVQADHIAYNEARISWTTDKDANASIDYGLTSAYGQSAVPVIDPGFAKTHSVFLSTLKPATLYHYRVKSTDAAGHLAMSDDQTFTTVADPAAAPAPYVFRNFEEAVLRRNGNGGDYPRQSPYNPAPNRLEGGDGTVTLDSTEAVDGRQSLKVEITTGQMYLAFWNHNYDGTVKNVLSPRGFAREWADDAQVNHKPWPMHTYNRFSFWIKVPANGPALAPNWSTNVDMGGYVKRVTNPDAGSDEAGGNHYYQRMAFYPNDAWTRVVVNNHPQHQRGGAGATEWGDRPHPTDEPQYLWWDTFTSFYIAMYANPTSYPVTYKLDAMEFFVEPYAENDEQVMNIAASWNPATSRLAMTWLRNKNIRNTHEVRYAFTDIHQSGWNAATPAPSGIIAPTDGWGMQYVTTQLPLAGHSVVYFAIKPQGSELFSQIALPLNVGTPNGGGGSSSAISVASAASSTPAILPLRGTLTFQSHLRTPQLPTTVTVTVKNATSTILAAQPVTLTNGAFQLPVTSAAQLATGPFTITVKAPGYVTASTTLATALSNAQISLTAAKPDLTGDDTLDIADLLAAIRCIQSSAQCMNGSISFPELITLIRLSRLP